MLTERPNPINYPIPEKPMTIDEYAQLMHWFISSVYFLLKHNPEEFSLSDMSMFPIHKELSKSLDSFEEALEKQANREPFHLYDHIYYNPEKLTGKYVAAKFTIGMQSKKLYDNVILDANTRRYTNGTLIATYPVMPFSELPQEQQEDSFTRKFYNDIAGSYETGTVDIKSEGELNGSLYNLDSPLAQYFFSFITLLNDEINKVVAKEETHSIDDSIE